LRQLALKQWEILQNINILSTIYNQIQQDTPAVISHSINID